MPLLAKLGKKIAELRKRNKLTQKALAAKLDIDTRQLRRIERGDINVTVSSIEPISTILNVDLTEFFNFELKPEERFDPDNDQPKKTL